MSERTMYPPQKDSPSTSTQGELTAVDIVVTVGSVMTLPQTLPYPLTLGIDKTVTETVLVTAIDIENNKLTIERGAGAMAWPSGTKCARVFTAADLDAVQKNIHDLFTELDEVEETVLDHDDRIHDLEVVVGDTSSGLVKAFNQEVLDRQNGDEAERNRSMTAEMALGINKIERTELPQVITDWTYIPTSTALTQKINRYNAFNKTSSTFNKTIPLGSPDTVGLITPEAYSEIINLRTDVTALQQQGGRFIGVSFATKADLDAYVIPATVHQDDFTYVLDDETKDGATTRYIYNGTAFVFGYVLESDPVGIASSTTPGVVLSDGGTNNGKVFVEIDGSMSVIGWDVLLAAVASKFTLPGGGSAVTFLNGLGQWATPAGGGALKAGTANFNGTTGVTITHNLNRTDYVVVITPIGPTTKTVGEFSYGPPNANTVVIYNTGTATSSFGYAIFKIE